MPAAAPTFAQDTNESRGTLKVEVTGSHIKRTDAETALPVQIITREEIDRAGWMTAGELMAHVSANLNGANSQISLGQAGNPGLSSANLRGLGDGNTLVLLNGRRLANYAFLSGTVNLNTIPLAAIDRVEILKDGASSIYGSDAIAGVVNFITRKDYSGAEVTGQAGVTQHGGGDHYQATVTAGYGDLAKDRFNAFVTVDWQKDTALAAHDRPFSRTAYLPEAGVDKLSFATFPANILLPDTFTFVNPSYASGCAPPASIPAIRFGPQACGFDYASIIDTVPPVEQVNVIARAIYQLTPDHQLFGELVYELQRPALEDFTQPRDRLSIPGLRALLPDRFCERQWTLRRSGCVLPDADAWSAHRRSSHASVAGIDRPGRRARPLELHRRLRPQRG